MSHDSKTDQGGTPMSEHNAHKELGGKVLTIPFIVLSTVAAIGIFFLLLRFVFGIGAVTNLNQGYPWGIWIVYDVLVGTAFACGGYALALLVYVLNRGDYHPLVRPALLASVFGYTLGGFSALFDTGRWYLAFNLFLPWHMNFNSVMLEVAVCVSIYTMVLWIEFSPALIERFGLEKRLTLVKRVLFAFIALGVLLPTMHQSSLGSLLVAAGQKVSPLWQTNLLPLLFLLSAITMGFSIVVFEASLSAWGFRRPIEGPLLTRLSRIIGGLLGVYLLLRFGDLIWRGALVQALAPGFETGMFWLENFLFVMPMVVVLSASKRAQPHMLFLAAVSLLLGGAVYRFNAYLIGFDPGPGIQYFPSLPEVMITLGIIALEIVAYLLFVKRLPVMHHPARPVPEVTYQVGQEAVK
jgi:Ni/Fe-hydrogenase subunit HybB-like protein